MNNCRDAKNISGEPQKDIAEKTLISSIWKTQPGKEIVLVS
jgi:hypothetical protein